MSETDTAAVAKQGFDLSTLVEDFGLDSTPTPETDSPQLLDDASEEAGAPIVAEQPTGEEVKSGDEKPTEEQKVDAKPEEAKATEEGHDPDLTPEENELVKSRPEAEREETARKLKAARFEDHFRNPLKPAEEVRSYLEGVSPARYSELEASVIERRLADPASFVSSIFQRDKTLYGKLALEVFNADRQYFTKELTGLEGVDPATLSTALAFYERNKDRIPETNDAPQFSEKDWAELEEWDGELAAKVKQLAATPATDKDEVARLTAELETLKNPPKSQEDVATKQAALQKEIGDTVDYGINHITTYLTSKAEANAGVAVTPKERESAPLVAFLKDMKRAVLFDGFGDSLKPFQPAFVEWGEGRDEKTRAQFKEGVEQLGYFGSKREKENAKVAAGKLVPFADKYMDERLRNPLFQQLDKLIELAASAINPTQTADDFIPGAGANVSQQKPSSPEAAFYDEAANFGIT